MIGSCRTYTTVTGYRRHAGGGAGAPPFELRLDAFEVAEAFEVPLAFLMTPAHHQRHEFELDGATAAVPVDAVGGPATDGTPRRYFIWGATAAMLRNLYRFLAA